jgi:hypothetical protein
MNKKMNRFCLLVVLLLFAGRLFAGDGSKADLIAIIQRLKVLRTYHYETDMHGVFPSGETDDMHRSIYMDVPHKRLCYKTSHYTLLLTAHWAYKADFIYKTVSVFNVQKYRAKYKDQLPELEALFDSTMLFNAPMDSMALATAKLASYSRKGNIGTFRLSFPEHFYIKAFVLVYNYTTGLPESVAINAFYPDSKRPDGTVSGTTYEIKCDHYATTVPENVFDTGQYFKVANGKIILTQYKSYKIYSVL